MNDYIIFVDASADMDPRFVQENDIRIVPMSYTLGGENRECARMEDEETLKRFYDGQRGGDFTHTSQVTPQQYMDAFSPILAEKKDILYISLSGGLTNSRDSIRIACDQLSEQYPGASVCTVDSICATGGMGLLAQQAVKNKRAGMTVRENTAQIELLKHRVCHLFMVEDLMYLKRGGRVSAASAMIGTALGIRPILVIDEVGKLTVVGKQRGQKKAISDLLARYSRTRGSDIQAVSIVHADAPDTAARLVEGVKSLNPAAEITCCMLSPIIGAHTGPGMAAVIYFGDRSEIVK